jgi:hypothetical protein
LSVDVHDHVITGQNSTALTGARIWTSLSPAHVQPSALMQLRPLLRATAICPDDQLAPVRIPSRRGPRRSTFQLYIPSGSRRPDHSNNLYSIYSHPLSPGDLRAQNTGSGIHLYERQSVQSVPHNCTAFMSNTPPPAMLSRFPCHVSSQVSFRALESITSVGVTTATGELNSSPY